MGAGRCGKQGEGFHPTCILTVVPIHVGVPSSLQTPTCYRGLCPCNILGWVGRGDVIGAADSVQGSLSLKK